MSDNGHYDLIILAAGGTARKLRVPGENENFGKGVSYCATCDGFFFRDKIVAVIGGGDTALEDALYERFLSLSKRSDVLYRQLEYEPRSIVFYNEPVNLYEE